MINQIVGGYATETSNKSTNIVGGALGSTPYQTAADATALLTGNITTTKKVLKQTGNGSVSAAPIWEQASIAECSDYASGTWTPTDASGAGLEFSSVVATYVKTANKVTLFASLVYPTTADASAAKIGGFPFTIANSLANRNPGSILASTGNAQGASAALAGVNVTLINASLTAVTNVSLTGATVRFFYEYLI